MIGGAILRVNTFVEVRDIKFRDWEHSSAEIKALVVNHNIYVEQGEGLNRAKIHIQCNDSMSLKFKVLDLYQERSPIIEFLENNFITDTSNDDFDYWDVMPPFGIVELYEIDLKCNAYCTKVMIEALFQLTFNLLLDYFNLIVFCSREIADYIDDKKMRLKRFVINEQLYYRSTTY
jgi:hypothetical protein